MDLLRRIFKRCDDAWDIEQARIHHETNATSIHVTESTIFNVEQLRANTADAKPAPILRQDL